MEDKRYEEVLERSREIYANPREALKDNVNLTNEGSVAAIKVALLDLFPNEELAESEDERIRKELIFFLKEEIPQCSIKEHANKLKEFLAYLEKQKEQKPKMTPRWLYRLEFKDSSCGLWYDGTGKWCFESGIGSIADCKTKNLPMNYDERYKQEGRDWFSSCSCKEDLMHWYSLEDAKELISKGFVFTRYLATEYHEYDQQTVFIKETSLYREEIDIFELFKKEPAEWSEEDEEMRKRAICACNFTIERTMSEGHYQEARDWLKSLPIGFIKNPNYNEDMIELLVSELRQVANENGAPKQYDKEIEWLKSLRPRPHWKPAEWSDEENLNTLIGVIKEHCDVFHINARGLVDWLKSLLCRPKSSDNLPKWKKASAGTKLSTDAVILYEGDPDPRIGKCAINDCIYIPITDLLTLDKDV